MMAPNQKLTFETAIVDSRPGAVVLDNSLFYPGGGGQLPDRGVLETEQGQFDVQGFSLENGRYWHALSAPVDLSGRVKGVVDPDFRFLMQQLHTGLHIINALIFQEFNGALVTGVQMAENGTARIDFDLPGADNDLIRALEPRLNEVIREDLPVLIHQEPWESVSREEGTLRSKAVNPPVQPDGKIRIVEIKGLDRQACGGTHLSSTGECGPLKIQKIDNKGRHNRRVRIGLA